MPDTLDHSALQAFFEKIKSAVDLVEDKVETAIVLEAMKEMAAHDGSLMSEKKQEERP